MPSVTPSAAAVALAGLLSSSVGCGTLNQASHPLPPTELGRLRLEIHDRHASVQAEQAEDAGRPDARLDIFEGRTYLDGAVLRVVSSVSGERRIPLGLVREIDADHSGIGFLLGVVGGGLAGLGVGWLMTRSSGDHQGFEGIYLLTMPVLGALVGGPIGAYSASGPVWRFSPPARAD